MYSSIIEILEESFGNRWFLDSGSLLGVIREGKFLPQDKGIDISVLVDNYFDKKIEKNVQKFKKIGFVISRRKWENGVYKYCLSPKLFSSFPYAIDLHLFVKNGEEYCCPQFSLLKKERGIKGLFANLKNGHMFAFQTSWKGMTRYIIYAIVSLVYRDLFQYFNQPVDVKKSFEKGRVIPYIWTIPINLFNGTEIGQYGGFRVISSPEKYLKYRYGEWRKTVTDWNTIRDDGGLRKSSEKEISKLFNR